MTNKFAIVTKTLQTEYEQTAKVDKTPELCGYFGRACRQMDKAEGANRALCLGCGLAQYCKA